VGGNEEKEVGVKEEKEVGGKGNKEGYEKLVLGVQSRKGIKTQYC